MNQEGGLPPITGGATGTATDVTEAARSLWCMVCNVMVKEVSAYEMDTAHHQIKCFLSALDILDNHIPRKKMKKAMNTNVSPPPTWVISYNYVCLLNLPDIMKEFGPLPNLWEGGGQGEKMLLKLKPLYHGYRSGWQKHLHLEVPRTRPAHLVHHSLLLLRHLTEPAAHGQQDDHSLLNVTEV